MHRTYRRSLGLPRRFCFARTIYPAFFLSSTPFRIAHFSSMTPNKFDKQKENAESIDVANRPPLLGGDHVFAAVLADVELLIRRFDEFVQIGWHGNPADVKTNRNR